MRTSFLAFGEVRRRFPRMSRSPAPPRLAVDLFPFAQHLPPCCWPDPSAVLPASPCPVVQGLLHHTTRPRAAPAMLWPGSTIRAASCWKFSLYCARVALVISLSLLYSITQQGIRLLGR